MNKRVGITTFIGLLVAMALPIAPTVAQTELLYNDSPNEDAEDFIPTDNAGSDDLHTQPASSSSFFYENEPSYPGTVQELRTGITEVTLSNEVNNVGEPGPARADQVRFVLELDPNE